MCGIVDSVGTLDLDKLAKDLTRDLPAYARPVFIRVMPSVDMTGNIQNWITCFGRPIQSAHSYPILTYNYNYLKTRKPYVIKFWIGNEIIQF